MEERELIQQICAGDPDAFRQLYDSYQHHVYNTAYGFVHNREDAEDLTQDVFVELFRSLSKFRSDSSLSTWVYRITVNKSLNHLRKKRPVPFQWLWGSGHGELAAPAPDPADRQPDPSQLVENRELQQAIEQALDALPEKQRAAFILDKFEDLSYKEIAEVMKLSLPAVESLLFRARRQLQRTLLSTRTS